MAFDLVRRDGLPVPVSRRVTRVEHESIVAAQKVAAVGFVHAVSVVTAAGMVRTARSIAGGDPAVQMAVDGLTQVGISTLEALQARFGLSL